MITLASRNEIGARSSFASPASKAQAQRAIAALEANGITVIQARDGVDAKRLVLELIPDGAQVHHGASKTLELTGIISEIDTSGRYESVSSRVRAMDRATAGATIRRMTAAPDVMLGSVHALTETGSLLAASSGGSQLAPYVAGAGQVILVVGAQKIVADVEEGLQRIYEYAFPLEDARALEAYGIHSGVNKIVIINREIVPGRITVVLVDEAIGF
jgi:hypothetical protein